MKSKESKAERNFPFLRANERERKPRRRGLTEIRAAGWLLRCSLVESG
jgi:hypothetical protein